jgi:hypothetical protein
VWLINIESHKQKVASGTISGLGGDHKFHFDTIPNLWFKIDIQEALMPAVALMFSIDVFD